MWGHRQRKLLRDAKGLICTRACLRPIQEKIGTLVSGVVQAYSRFHRVLMSGAMHEAGRKRVRRNDIIGARILRVQTLAEKAPVW